MKPVFFIVCIFFSLGHAQFDGNKFENLLFNSGEGNIKMADIKLKVTVQLWVYHFSK